MPIVTCPGCGSTSLKSYAPSRRTERRNFRCRSCGLLGWSDRADLVMPDSVGLDEISVEAREAWIASKRTSTADAAYDEALDRLESRLGDPNGRRIYDIGAGDGLFLAHAAKRGYDVRGNDLIQANVEIAKARYDIPLDLGDISTLELEPVDAVTLWCVIAHVEDPTSLLQHSYDLLGPGGAIFLQTPRRTWVDRAALGVAEAAKGRLTHWSDRRIAPHHWLLHTARSMKATLESLGFVDVEVLPRARYSLDSHTYLRSMGVPSGAARGLAKAADGMIRGGLAPRIVLEAYARKPGALSPVG